MNSEYRYFKDHQGKTCRIHIERDNYPLCPRYEQDGNIGHMMVWWNRYQLGDYKENTYSSPEDFLNNLVREKASEKTIINFIKAKKTSNGLELKYNRKDELWELWGYYYWFPLGSSKESKFGVIESNNPIDYLVDDMIEAMSFEDKWKLLERNGVYYLPLYIYEHSGITISTGGFSCPWDSGQAGWIYTTKEDVLECGGKIQGKKKYIKVTERNWKRAAQLWLEGEVEQYDQYLQGDCYGYVIDELDPDTNEWDENTDSCWGYYSNKWGDELIEEIAREVVNNLYERLEDVA